MLEEKRLQKILSGAQRHPNYKEAQKASDEALLHSEGKGIEKLINRYHPHEPDWIKQYRKANLRRVSRAVYKPVVDHIRSMGEAEDFRINFPQETSEQVDFADYCQNNFNDPRADSVHSWCWDRVVPRMLSDPNGWIVWCLGTTVESNTYSDQEAFRPTAIFFPCEQVLDYEEGKFVVIKLQEKKKIQQPDGSIFEGDVYLEVSTMSIGRWEQQNPNRKEQHTYVKLFDHNFGLLPAQRVKGAETSNEQVDESFLAPAFDNWKTAIVEYSDKQGAIVTSVMPESAVYTDTECRSCEGQGTIRKKTGLDSHGQDIEENVTCPSCKGVGFIPSPYSQLVVTPQNWGATDGEGGAPFPPKVYIEPSMEPVKFLKDDVKDELQAGLNALHFHWLGESILNQSGVAKTIDREPLNQFLRDIAGHIRDHILRPTYFFLASWKYGLVPGMEEDVPGVDIEAIDEFVPTIDVPHTFNVVGPEVVSQEIQAARTSGMSPDIISNMEMDLAEKRFGHDEETLQIMRLSRRLNPLPAYSVDELLALKASQLVRPLDILVALNMTRLLREAIRANADFLSLEEARQLERIYLLAKELQEKVSSETAPPALAAFSAGQGTPPDDDEIDDPDDATE